MQSLFALKGLTEPVCKRDPQQDRSTNLPLLA
jgi:hypothetical protein